LAALHFPPTPWAAENLRQEGVPEDRIAVTGNTGIDALLQIRRRLEEGSLPGLDGPWVKTPEKLILVTSHRRESFGSGLEEIGAALAELTARPDTRIVFPVHPNPEVAAMTRRWLTGCDRVHLLEPQSYVPFVDLMRQAYVILTDSGGVQEEAPSLGKPVLVLREKTERPEAVQAGTSRLVGTNRQRIVSETARLLEDSAEYEKRSRIHNPYGDGQASEQIANRILRYFETGGEA
jgi:UDP-N-acetylglucosamine 2-epimerase (non-hydrolysing)